MCFESHFSLDNIDATTYQPSNRIFMIQKKNYQRQKCAKGEEDQTGTTKSLETILEKKWAFLDN